MDFLVDLTSFIVEYLNYILIVVLLIGGIYFTLKTKFLPLRSVKEQLRSVTDKPDGKTGVSSFQALMVSTASRVGTGNIVGVAVAICMGGYGSVFWMWLIALIGMSSAFAESTLAQIFKRKGKNEFYGGPSYYIEGALKNRTLAVIFSVLIILTYGVGFNMLASFNLQDTFRAYEFYNPQITPWIIGLTSALAVAYCLFGGGKRILKVTSFLVPVMGILYVLVALIVIVLNIKTIPYIFTRIFTEAFDFKAIFGGFTGSCLVYGIKRGLFSNEAGVGSAPNASASADVSHPAKQGFVQMLSVFLDTIVVCSATAFLCLCSGIEPTSKISGAPYVQLAVSKVLGNFGPVFITVAMIFFAFTTLLGNLYYVDKAIFHILKKEPTKKLQHTIYIIASLLIFVGACLTADLLWNIADITMGLMALINIPVILILSKYVFRTLKDYEKQRKENKDPVFKAKDIDLPYDTDCWK